MAEEMDFADAPSKSRRKRERKAIHDLGTQLVALSDKQLAKIPLSDELRITCAQTRTLAKGARKRQLQYLGGQLAAADTEAIRIALEAVLNPGREEIARFHEIEQWRDRLIDGDDASLDELATLYPRLDRQTMRQLMRNAKNERSANKSPRAARQLFSLVRDLFDQGN